MPKPLAFVFFVCIMFCGVGVLTSSPEFGIVGLGMILGLVMMQLQSIIDRLDSRRHSCIKADEVTSNVNDRSSTTPYENGARYG